jgi:hypothetical protein
LMTVLLTVKNKEARRGEGELQSLLGCVGA